MTFTFGFGGGETGFAQPSENLVKQENKETEKSDGEAKESKTPQNSGFSSQPDVIDFDEHVKLNFKIDGDVNQRPDNIPKENEQINPSKTKTENESINDNSEPPKDQKTIFGGFSEVQSSRYTGLPGFGRSGSGAFSGNTSGFGTFGSTFSTGFRTSNTSGFEIPKTSGIETKSTSAFGFGDSHAKPESSGDTVTQGRNFTFGGVSTGFGPFGYGGYSTAFQEDQTNQQTSGQKFQNTSTSGFGKPMESQVDSPFKGFVSNFPPPRFTATREEIKTAKGPQVNFYQSITRMDIYSRKSFEELAWDYMKNDEKKDKPTGFNFRFTDDSNTIKETTGISGFNFGNATGKSPNTFSFGGKDLGNTSSFSFGSPSFSESHISILCKQAKEINPFLYLKYPKDIRSEMDNVHAFRKFITTELKKDLTLKEWKYLHTGITEMLKEWHNGSFSNEDLDEEALDNYLKKYPSDKLRNTDSIVKMLKKQYENKSMSGSFRIKIAKFMKENYDPVSCLDSCKLFDKYTTKMIEDWKNGKENDDLDAFDFSEEKLTRIEKVNGLKKLSYKVVLPFWNDSLEAIEQSMVDKIQRRK